MKILVVCFAFVIFIAASFVPAKSSPATCTTLFADQNSIPPVLQQILKVINRPIVAIPPDWFAVMQSAHYEFRSASFRPIGNSDTIYGELLWKRYEKSDEAARLLLQVGFRIVNLKNGRKAIVPHENWVTTPAFFTAWQLLEIHSGRIPEDDELLPAVILRRRRAPRFSANPEDYEFVRPFLDAWPSSKNYELVRGAENMLPSPVFRSALLQSKYPFAIGPFEEHDASHLTEFRNWPPIMGHLKKTARNQIDNPDDDELESVEPPSQRFHRRSFQ